MADNHVVTDQVAIRDANVNVENERAFAAGRHDLGDMVVQVETD